MQTQQRNAIFTFSALTLATAFAGLAFLYFQQAPATDQPVVDQAGDTSANGPQGAKLEEAAAGREAQDPRTANEVASGLFSAAPGTVLAFELVNTGSSTISNHEGGVLQSFGVDLRGELEIGVLARRGDEMAVAIRLPHSKFEQRAAGEVQGAQGAGAFEAALARPVIVRARADGTTLGFRFDAQAPPDERNHMRALWTALVPVAPEPLSETWVAEQQDAFGLMRCNYRLVGAQAEQVEIERTSRVCIGIEPSRPTPKFSGTSRIHIDRNLGWFDSVASDEITTIEVDLTGMSIFSQQSARCTLTRVRRDGTVGIDWDLAWEPVSGAADAALMAERNREQQLRDALDGRTLEQLVDQLSALLAAGDMAAPELVRLREEIGFLLSIDPAALAQLAELVLDPRLSADVVATLIDCVGRAGTPEAQALLAQWISDADRSKSFRTESVYALIELKQPGDNVVAAVAGLLGDGVDPELQGGAILTMGALANIGGTHTAAGFTAFNHVMNWKESAEGSGRLPEWIEALGNTGSPQVVEAVKPYLLHAEEFVRGSAVHALRLVFTLEVSEIAAVRGQEDTSVHVRGRAAEVLGARADNYARTAIARMLDHDDAEDVRRTLILQLGCQVANDVVARALLEDAAASDPSAELRELAHQQLSSVHHG